MTKVELSNEDAELFKEFQRHYKEFKSLVDSGFFNFKAGKAEIHKSSDGVIQEIYISSKTFKRKKQ